MFDIGWSELLIIGVMALIVVGPKDLPVLLRTIGRYVGMIRRQAADFRAQFDEALRESELDQIRKDMNDIRQDVSSTVRDAGRQVERDLDPDRKDASAKTTLEDKADLQANGGEKPSPRRPFGDDDDFDASSYDEDGEFDVDEWNRKVLEEEKRASSTKSDEAGPGAPPAKVADKPAEKSGV